jgi:hypothetical protein
LWQIFGLENWRLGVIFFEDELPTIFRAVGMAAAVILLHVGFYSDYLENTYVTAFGLNAVRWASLSS